MRSLGFLILSAFCLLGAVLGLEIETADGPNDTKKPGLFYFNEENYNEKGSQGYDYELCYDFSSI